MNRPEKIVEAVTVCIYYSDFLKYCINNKKYLDRWIIVTVEDDLDTIQLCKNNSLEYIFSREAFKPKYGPNKPESDRLTKWVAGLDIYSKLEKEAQVLVSTIPFNGRSLAKGKAVNEGIDKLGKTGWILHLDCDIVLPKNIRDCIDSISLTKKNIESLFGLKGRRILGAHKDYRGTRDFATNQKYHSIFYKHWLRHIKKTDKNQIELHQARKEIMHRLGIATAPKNIKDQWYDFINNKWDQLVYPFDGPHSQQVGFFQLFHAGFRSKYSSVSQHIGVDDVLFRESYPKNRRQVLDVDCVHIGLPASGMVDLPYLDDYVLNIKHSGEYQFLNEICKQKNQSRAKIFLALNEDFNSSRKHKTFVDRRNSSKLAKSSLGLKWTGWKDTIFEIKKEKDIVFNHRKTVIGFQPIPFKKWFGFSVHTKKPLNRSKFQTLFLELKIEDLNCDFYLGYGSRDKQEWHLIKIKTLKNRTWYKIRIEFAKRNSINFINTVLAIRSHGDYECGRIVVGDVYFQ
jgi:hypothetical protein